MILNGNYYLTLHALDKRISNTPSKQFNQLLQIVSELVCPAPTWGPASRRDQLSQLSAIAEPCSSSPHKEREQLSSQNELHLVRHLCAHLEQRRLDYNFDSSSTGSTHFHAIEQLAVDKGSQSFQND